MHFEIKVLDPTFSCKSAWVRDICIHIALCFVDSEEPTEEISSYGHWRIPHLSLHSQTHKQANALFFCIVVLLIHFKWVSLNQILQNSDTKLG